MNQVVSLRTGETICGKEQFKKHASEYCNKIQKYHADNKVFVSEDYKTHCKNRNQTLDYSGGGAHHQNAVAERAIQTVIYWARAMLVHQMIHWPDEGDKDLWPFALEYAVWIWNHLPNKDSGYAPMELWMRMKNGHT
eukprot:scaffold224920_cov33-Attheya_sp.AAC.1